LDETQFEQPDEYNFDEDLEKPADLEDAYDERVPSLPVFTLWKLGRNRGYSKVNWAQ
jgi:hypothetical protein